MFVVKLIIYYIRKLTEKSSAFPTIVILYEVRVKNQEDREGEYLVRPFSSLSLISVCDDDINKICASLFTHVWLIYLPGSVTMMHFYSFYWNVLITGLNGLSSIVLVYHWCLDHQLPYLLKYFTILYLFSLVLLMASIGDSINYALLLLFMRMCLPCMGLEGPNGLNHDFCNSLPSTFVYPQGTQLWQSISTRLQNI